MQTSVVTSYSIHYTKLYDSVLNLTSLLVVLSQLFISWDIQSFVPAGSLDV